MCNLSLGIEEKARKETLSENVKNYMKRERRLGISIEEIKKGLNEIFMLNQDEIEEYISSSNN